MKTRSRRPPRPRARVRRSVARRPADRWLERLLHPSGARRELASALRALRPGTALERPGGHLRRRCGCGQGRIGGLVSHEKVHSDTDCLATPGARKLRRDAGAFACADARVGRAQEAVFEAAVAARVARDHRRKRPGADGRVSRVSAGTARIGHRAASDPRFAEKAGAGTARGAGVRRACLLRRRADGVAAVGAGLPARAAAIVDEARRQEAGRRTTARALIEVRAARVFDDGATRRDVDVRGRPDRIPIETASAARSSIRGVAGIGAIRATARRE